MAIAINLPELGRPYARITTAAAFPLSAVDDDTIIALYKAHGAILLRGFALDLDAFGDFAARFCATSVPNKGPQRTTLHPARNIQSVSGGTRAFPQHPELSREPWKPDACFFGCFNPPTRGGLTTVCDGVALAAALPPVIRDGLATRRLRYAMPATPGELAYWLGTAQPDDALLAAPPPGVPYSFRRADGGIERSFTRPALHRPMFTDAPAFGNYLLFARFGHGRRGFPCFADGGDVPDGWLHVVHMLAERTAVPVAWQRGDVLMLDNTRFMHGRTAIENARERRIATYFGYLRFALPDIEEPADPPWRRPGFGPPPRD